MPRISPIQSGQTLTKQTQRKHARAVASEHVTNGLHEARHGRERRFRHERRLNRIKMSFDRRHQSNRRRHTASENTAETDNNIGQHINTEA